MIRYFYRWITDLVLMLDEELDGLFKSMGFYRAKQQFTTLSKSQGFERSVPVNADSEEDLKEIEEKAVERLVNDFGESVGREPTQEEKELCRELVEEFHKLNFDNENQLVEQLQHNYNTEITKIVKEAVIVGEEEYQESLKKFSKVSGQKSRDGAKGVQSKAKGIQESRKSNKFSLKKFIPGL